MRKFLVIGAARTGSTLLMQILSSSPDTKVYFELFHRKELTIDGVKRSDEIPQRNAAPFEWLENILGSSGKPVVGFKIFPNQNDSVLNTLIEDNDVAKIVIFRENFLAVYSSLLISTARANWSATTGEAVPLKDVDRQSHTWNTQVEFDRNDFERRYHDYLNFYRSVTKKLVDENQKFLFVEYGETLNENLMRRMFPFIGASQPSSININMQKNNTSRIMQRFANKEDVRDYLNEIGKWDWSSESFFVW